MTIIDLGECESLLRQAYNISDDEMIFMKKIDINQEGMKIPKIEYDLYAKINGSSLDKLDISYCSKTKIDILVPVKLSESIDKLNSSSSYYNDICYTTTSDSGTDLILNDRKAEFIGKNKTLCQEGCFFSQYDYENNKAKCSCEVKSSSSSFGNININKTKLYENFINIKNIANFQILSCFSVLFTKKGIIKNYGSYSLIIIILSHFIIILIFIIKKDFLNII